MSAWPTWVLFGLIVLNFASLALYLVTIRCQRRYLTHLRVADRLLTNICVDAFRMQHMPVFQAWSRSMGSIDVEISANRKEWTE